MSIDRYGIGCVSLGSYYIIFRCHILSYITHSATVQYMGTMDIFSYQLHVTLSELLPPFKNTLIATAGMSILYSTVQYLGMLHKTLIK
jgi:hypothetical protein